jgi:uncharacterized membrane protein YfcA
MTLEMMLLLGLAGLAGGAINAVAGGATFLTFPAMVAAGLPPTIANASSSVALTPGHFFGMLADRRQLPAFDGVFWLSLATIAAGAASGAALLYITSERQFAAIIPALIGVATLIFAFGRKARDWMNGMVLKPADKPAQRNALLVPAAIYVGYFGAGAGVVMMALFSLTSQWSVRTSNAVKNLYGAVGNWSAIAFFVYSDMIDWPATLPMLAGAVIGGLAGGKLLHFLPPHVLRGAVIAAGTLVTCLYMWKYWL